MANWQTPVGSEDELQHLIGDLISSAEQTRHVRLPDLRQANDLVIAMDYSGEHQSAEFQCLVFYLAERDAVLGKWNDERRFIRKNILTDGRRQAFKKLTDSCRQKALLPFLNATSEINGVLLCVALDKRLLSTSLGYEPKTSGDLKPLVFAKLVRIAFFGSILVGGLAKKGQGLFWITDDDEIVSNEACQKESAYVVRAMLDKMCPFGLGEVELSIAGKCKDDLFSEDLCSVPDLVGGALSESLSRMGAASMPQSTNLFTPLMKPVATKTQIINHWLALRHQKMSVIICVIREGENGLLLSFGSPSIIAGDIGSRQLWLPPDRGWDRVIRSWRFE